MLKHLTKNQINKKRLTKKQINKKRLSKRSKFVRYNKKYKNQSGGNICNLFTDLQERHYNKVNTGLYAERTNISNIIRRQQHKAEPNNTDPLPNLPPRTNQLQGNLSIYETPVINKKLKQFENQAAKFEKLVAKIKEAQRQKEKNQKAAEDKNHKLKSARDRELIFKAQKEAEKAKVKKEKKAKEAEEKEEKKKKKNKKD